MGRVSRTIVAVGYARYSTNKQTDNSIEYQKNAILQFCREKGLTLRRFYVDEATTGTNMARQGLQQLIRDAERGDFNTVIIYDISRGSRNVGDWFNFRNLMLEFGVQVIAVHQELGDVTDPNAFLKEAITVSFAQYEVLQARNKSMAGSKQRASKAKFMGGTPPLGYDIVDGEYVINEVEARWVKTIHYMYAMGAKYREILEAIPEARSKLGNPLDATSLHAILKNPRYDGTFIWNEFEHKVMGMWSGRTPKPKDEVTKIPGGIPAIVTPELKKEVLKRMASRAYGGRNSAKRDYLLTGLIECELCGSTYHGRTSKNKKGFVSVSYVCGNKYNYRRNRTTKCTAPNIQAAKLESFVVAKLKEFLKTADFTAMAKEIARQVNNASAELKEEKAELAKINTQLHNGMKAILDGMYFPELQDEMDRLRVRKNELEEIIATVESNQRKVSVEDVLKLFDYSVELLEEGNVQQAIQRHVTKIYAHADGKCTINMGVCINGCGGAQYIVHTTFIFNAA